MPDTTLTWLGHATFRFDTPGGKRLLYSWLTIQAAIGDKVRKQERRRKLKFTWFTQLPQIGFQNPYHMTPSAVAIVAI